jgi:Raf kinase inhibitor-like YbhB/YbcL family protein
MRALVVAAAAACALAPPGRAQVGTTGAVLAVDAVAPRPMSIQLESSSIRNGGSIPAVHSDHGGKVSPTLSWTGVPKGTRSIALMMEDPDAREPKPFVHWILYNLPAATASVREGLSSSPRLPELGGALQGRTSRGNIGYFGPRPPTGDPAHRYHFQIFALDTALALQPGASRDEVLGAMKGHVLAAGRLVGTFKAPADAK